MLRASIFLPLLAALVAGVAGEVNAADPKPAAVPNTLQQRVAACIACHGKEGEGLRKNEYYPRLAGKPADYLYNQLLNFREGRRVYPPMTYLVDYLSNAYLREIAEYFAALRPPYPPPLSPAAAKEVLDRGETLVTKGDSSRDVPACAACHGKALTGMQPAIPGLVGLYPDYIAAQLGAWKNKKRQANAPDCMADIASRLAPEDISAVAAWLAAQPAPVKTLPAPAKSQKLPIACGSAPE